MNCSFDKNINLIAEKVEADKRLTFDKGMILFTQNKK